MRYHAAARADLGEAAQCLLALLRGGNEQRSEAGALLLAEGLHRLIGGK